MADIAVAFALLVIASAAMTLGVNGVATTIAWVAGFLVYLWVAMGRRLRRAASESDS